MANKTYTVTVASGNSYGGGTGNVYYLDGVRNATGPGTIEWVAGSTLRFEQSDGTNNSHPLIFSTNTSTSGIISANVTYYLDGASNQANYINASTFNAATTRYVEITPSSQTDFYYLCYIHGIGMGGIFDITQNTWGSLPWSNNAWQSLTSLIQPTGLPLSMSVGSAQSVPRNGWGGTNYNNGQWSDLLNSGSQVSGFGLSATLSEENVTGEINTGWGRFQWNAASWGTFGTLLATGQQLSSNLGSVTTTEEVNEGWSRVPGWSTFSWGIQGQALGTGISISANTGSVTIDGEVNIGWSSDAWGIESWGISGLTPDVTGIGLTATLGTPIASIDTATSTTGQQMTATLNSVLGSATVDAFATGIPITMSLTFDPAIAIPTGQQLTGTSGTAVLDANTIVELSTIVSSYYGSKTWGLGVWGNQPTETLAMTSNEGTVDPEPDAVITGIQMTATLNNVVVQADANSGTITPIKWGEETWGLSTWGDGTYLDGSGYSEAATINLGTAVLDNITIADPAGQALTMQLNSVTEFDGNANVTPTGLGLTMALGTNTTLIWNQVDTGTAPVDPPGWQEVAA